MTEQEYTDVSDRVKVSAALNLLRDIVADSSSVIDKDKLKEVTIQLRNWERDLFKVICLDETPEKL